MGSLSTFGAFTTARLGMYASMKGLDITGHNIANINTYGYTRQKLEQSALKLNGADRYYSVYDARVGSGTLITGISQLRDPYLDIRFRNESASLGSADAKLSGLEDLAQILDEVAKNDGDGVLEKQFTDLLKQLQNLSTKPNQTEYEDLVRSSASTLVTLLKGYSTSLEGVAKDQENGYQQDLGKVNGILENIRNLNESIRNSEIHGDGALELRDQRNLLLDQLSQYAKINVSYEMEDLGAGIRVQNLVITLDDGNNTPLVDGGYCGQLSAQSPTLNTDPGTNGQGKYLDATTGQGTDDITKAVMTDNPDKTLTVSPLKNRGGSLLDPTSNGGFSALGGKFTGALESTRKILTSAGEFTVVNGVGVPTTERGIPYYRNALDSLAQKFAQVMNDANQQYQVDSDGFYLDANGQQISDGAGGFLNKKSITDAQKSRLEASGNKLGGPLFSNSELGNDGTNITAGNISISKGWAEGSVKLLSTAVKNPSTPDGSSDAADNILHIIYQLGTADHTFTPSDIVPDASGVPFAKGSFQKMLAGVQSTLAIDISDTTALLRNCATTAESLDIGRDSVSSVDLNDEAANMMQYQKSYAAACRLMTTIDEALDKLINGTGVVGR